MKYLFLVQGEGRGHMTQAISLYSLLKENGHEVVGVLLGKNPHRQIPTYVFDKFKTYTAVYESPNFVFDRQHKGIHITRSLINNLTKVPVYFKSIEFVHSVIKESKPDVIINFYDLIGGLCNFRYPHKKFICVGHQFLVEHPDFPSPVGRTTEKWLLHRHNTIVSINASKCLALSFRSMDIKERKNAIVVPPLLRKEIMQNVKEIQNKGYLNGYLLNDGFATEIVTWHRINKHLPAHFFWDKPDAPQIFQVHENLTFHQINDSLFMEYLRNCNMFAGTAGFESLCESMYLGKPFLCVPSTNHYEQACNALDATINGAGIYDDYFNIDRLVAFHDQYDFDFGKFRQWVDKTPEIFLELLT